MGELKTNVANIFIKFFQLDKQIANSTNNIFYFKENIYSSSNILSSLHPYLFSYNDLGISYNQLDLNKVEYLYHEYYKPVVPLLVFQANLFQPPTRRQIQELKDDYLNKIENIRFDKKIVHMSTIEYKPYNTEYKTEINLDDNIISTIDYQIDQCCTYIRSKIVAFKEYFIHKITFFSKDSIDDINIMINYLEQDATTKIGYELIRNLETEIHPNHYRELVNNTVDFCNELNQFKIEIYVSYETSLIKLKQKIII